MLHLPLHSFFFFFNDTATTEIYTLSLHDALPILTEKEGYLILNPSNSSTEPILRVPLHTAVKPVSTMQDRKSTRLNSSHGYISYAVFCLKKKKKRKTYRIVQ